MKDGNGAIVATYYYDPFGRRLWKDIGATRTYSMYADEGLIAEFDGTGTETKSYGYAPNSTWTTNPLFMKHGTQYYFYHNDHLGTPQKMTAVNGSKVWSAKYESFGKAVIDPASILVNNLRFPGQYYDQETGLHYNWHRHYDPKTAKYLSPDPVKISEREVNLYTYVANSPANLTDASGLLAAEGAAIGVAIAGAEAGIVVLSGTAVAAVGVGTYALTTWAVEDTWIGKGGLGEWVYDITHRRPFRPDPYDIEKAKRNLKSKPLPAKIIRCADETLPPPEKNCFEGCRDRYPHSRLLRWFCYLGCWGGGGDEGQ